MKLYLIQHAEAKSESVDPERGLTEKGFNDIGKTARFAVATGAHVERIFHSGKKRARETAEVLAGYIKAIVSEADALSPMDDPTIWAGRIKDMNENTALVGHMPHMGGLAGLLLAGDKDKRPVDFKMGCIVCLGRSEAGWAVEWMVVPEVIK